MSFAEKLYIEKKTPYYGSGEVIWRISLYEKGYAGDPIAMTGQASPFRLRYEGDDSKRNIFEPIHEATLSMRFKIRSESQRTMLQDMFGSDENQHQLVLSRNGEVALKSAMLTDLADVSEGPVPFNAELKGKVIARTKGQDFPMSGQKVTVAQLLAELFSSLGYEFGIREITDWMEANTADGSGLFGQVYVDKYMLREFASNADEVDKPLKSKDILSQLMRRFSAHLLPWRRWNVIQPDAMVNAAVYLYDYDATGAAGSVQYGQNIDKAVSKAAGFYLLPSSGSNQVGGIKRSKLVFNHRSKPSQPDFSNDIVLYPGDSPDSITASFASDGSQYVKFSGKATVHFDTQYLREQANGYIEITIHAGSYYFDGDGWVSGPARVKYTVNQLLVKQNVTIDFDITTPPAPADADGPLILQVSNYSYDVSSPSNEWLRYQDLSFNIVNGDIAKGDNKKVEKRLDSPREFSLEHDQGELYLGDGPTIYARSSLLTYNATQDYYVHTANWLRKGDAAGINIDELTLREINNLLRSGRKLLRAELLADYEPTQILVYAGKRFMFLFGELDGGSGKWIATFVELKRETAADVLTEYFDTDGVDSGSAPSTGSVTGSSKDGGVTDHGDMTGLQDDDHTQYVHVSKARAVSAIHDYQNGFKVGGSTFVDAQRNITANKGTFADVISSQGDIIAFSSGGGSSPAPSTVSYDTVNVATQINLRGKALFNSNDLIPASLIDGTINGGTADSVAWADVTGKPSTAGEWATETGFDGRYALSTDFSSHVNSTANPHLVTASQVGLGNVPNSNNLSAFVNGPGFYKSGDSPSFANVSMQALTTTSSIDQGNAPLNYLLDSEAQTRIRGTNSRVQITSIEQADWASGIILANIQGASDTEVWAIAQASHANGGAIHIGYNNMTAEGQNNFADMTSAIIINKNLSASFSNLLTVSGGIVSNSDLSFSQTNLSIKYPREIWLRENAWASGDYFNWRVGGNLGDERIAAIWHDQSIPSDTEVFRLYKDGKITAYNLLRANGGIQVPNNGVALYGLDSSSGQNTELLFWNGINAYYGRNASGGSVDNHYFRTSGTTRLVISDTSVTVDNLLAAQGGASFGSTVDMGSNYLKNVNTLRIGSNERLGNGGGFELSGGTSSAFVGVQDGNGRIQLKWNATRATNETYLVSSEPAFFWDMTISSDPIWEMKYDGGANAGDPINWTTLAALRSSGDLKVRGNLVAYSSGM